MQWDFWTNNPESAHQVTYVMGSRLSSAATIHAGTDGDMVPNAYTLHTEDDDFGHPGTLVLEVFNDEQRAQLVEQVAGSLLGGVRSPVAERAFDYWKKIDANVGGRIEEKVRTGKAAEPAAGMGEA